MFSYVAGAGNDPAEQAHRWLVSSKLLEDVFESLSRRESLLLSAADAAAGILSMDRRAVIQTQQFREVENYARRAYHPAHADALVSHNAAIHEAGIKAATKKAGNALAGAGAEKPGGGS